MGIRVNVTSVQAIADFRASMIVYLTKARAIMEEISGEVFRNRNWVQSTQRNHWEGIAKRRARDLEEAQAALFSAKMSSLREVSSAEQMALTKARRAMEEVDVKMRIIKRWDREFDNVTGPPAKQLEKLDAMLADDLVNAVAYLAQILETLDAYAGIVAPSLVDEVAPPKNSDDANALPQSAELSSPGADNGGDH